MSMSPSRKTPRRTYIFCPYPIPMNTIQVLPGPRPSAHFLPASYPPAPQSLPYDRSRWAVANETPMPKSRGPYVSPDPSPTGSDYQGPRAYPVHPPPHYQPIAIPQQHHSRVAMPLWQSPPEPHYFPPPYATPPRRPTNGRKNKKTDGKQPTFLTKLYAVLEQPEYQNIIRWDEAGEVIIIEKPEELANKVLPLVYKQSRFASFSRQLNIYGFMRKVSLRHVDRGIVDPDASTWSHPFLRRDSSREDIISFKRRVPPRPSQAKRRMSIPEEVVSPISDSSASFDSPPEGFTRSSYIESDDETRPMPMAFPTLYPVRVMTPPPLIEHGQLGSPFVAESVKEQHDSDTINDPAQIFRFNLDPNHSGVPQTAPAGANVFGMPIRIHQDSFRTRSVQGEPPSATLFSPTSPLAQESWLPEMEMSEGMVKAEPTDGENGTWMRRVYTNMPRYQTSSLPVSPPEYVMRRPTHHTSNSLQFIPTSYTAAIVEVASTTPTVSPGIFQTGFSFPPPNQASPRPHTMPLTSSRPVSSNDSPHSVPGYFAPLHTDIELDGQGQGQGQGEVGPDVPMTTAMEDSLPSASLPGFHHSGPFDQVLRDDTVV